MTEQAAAAQAVVDAVGQITFGPESTFENLSVVPLLRGPGAGRGLRDARRGARARTGRRSPK